MKMWECLDTEFDYDWIDVPFLIINVWCDILNQNQTNNNSTLAQLQVLIWQEKNNNNPTSKH